MIAGVLLFLVSNAATLLGARALLGRVKTGEPSLDLVLFVILRLLLISGAILLAGVGQGLDRWSLGLSGALGLALLLAAGAHRGLPRPSWPDCGRWLGLATLVVAARFVLQVWFFAPHLGDPLGYHLPKIGEWIRAGGFTRELGLHPHGTFPAGFELIETWWVVFLRHDVLIEAAGAEFLVLAFVSVRALGRHLGFDSRGSWLAALIFVLTPGLHLGASSCLNDTAAAAMIVATMALVAARVPVSLLAMTVGLGAGIKATTVYALPGVVLLAWLVRREPSIPNPSRRWSGALAAAGLAAGGFWYLRNLVWYRNPVYPVGEPGYSGEPVAVQVGPRWETWAANVGDLLGSRVYDSQTALGANVDGMAGWGPVAFACGAVALLAGVGRQPALRRLAAGFLCSLAVCLLLIIHDPWCLKYVFFFPALLCLAVVPLAQAHRPVAVLTAAGLLASFAATLLPYDLPAPEFARLFRQDWRSRSALEEPEEVRAEDSLACFGRLGAGAFLLYRPDFSRRVIYLHAGQAGELLDQFERSGARFASLQPAGEREREILEECLRRGRLKWVGATFYRLLPAAAESR